MKMPDLTAFGSQVRTISSRDYSGDCPKPVSCPYCGRPRYWSAVNVLGRLYWCPEPDDCDCGAWKAAEAAKAKATEVRERERRIDALVKKSGLSAKMRGMTFLATKLTDENREAVDLCRRYAAAKTRAGHPNGLYLSGAVGVGKTHLAAAIANDRLAQERSVICRTQGDILLSVRETYSGAKSEEKALEKYLKADLLIIDDMGEEKATEWATSLLFRLVDRRYNALKPIIVTTNYDLPGLANRLTSASGNDVTALAIIDRLREMCYFLPMKGESWRRAK